MTRGIRREQLQASRGEPRRSVAPLSMRSVMTVTTRIKAAGTGHCVVAGVGNRANPGSSMRSIENDA